MRRIIAVLLSLFPLLALCFAGGPVKDNDLQNHGFISADSSSGRTINAIDMRNIATDEPDTVICLPRLAARQRILLLAQ